MKPASVRAQNHRFRSWLRALASTGAIALSLSAFGAGCAKLEADKNDSGGAPVDVSYAANPARYPYGLAITPNKPVTAKAVTSYSISPDLPTGLSFDTRTGIISGTPANITSEAVYTIRVANTVGSAFVRLTLAVVDRPPTITYGGNVNLDYTVGSAIPTIAPTLGGGPAVGCVSTPSLPAGLSLSTQCVLTGTPTAATAGAPARTAYVITPVNSGGSAPLTLNIQVTDLPPAFNYGSLVFSLIRGAGLSASTGGATSSGGVITSCASSPALPAGLSLSSTCSISGTPTAVAASASYAITATNSGGTATRTLTLDVHDVAPILAFSPNTKTFTKGTAITAFAPGNTGGVINSCAVAPALPAGLSLNSSTCAISGTPTAIASATSHTVTATNGAGTGTASVTVTVNDRAPVIQFIGSPYVYTQNSAITPTIVNGTGGAPVACSASPSLPAGLSIHATTCVISGTPTAAAPQATYVVTATNTGGTGSTSIQLRVNPIAPNQSYPGSPYSFPKSVALSPVTPANTGGTPASCVSVPSLPAGLSLSSTCVISGTPTAITASAPYTITATNSGGTGSATIQVTVNDVAPAISYVGSPFTYGKNTAIAALTPASTGGTVVSCASSPTLPAGLSLSSTCVISGTPTAVSPATGYSITATNSGGSASVAISIAVNDLLPAISYAGGPFTYGKGTAIATLTPSSTGGTVTSCASNPGLPAGLSLSTTCLISGTPTAVAASATYTITATNSAGSASTAIVAAVNDVAPTLSYAGSPFTYTVGSAIATLTPTIGGGAIVTCTSSPALPAGLSLAGTTCALSGTPSAPVAATAYTITAANSGGNATATINITVNAVVPALTYASSPFTFIKSTAIASQAPANSGGAPTSCSVLPALPSGLALSSACVLSGTPTVVSASTSYTVTATNSGGSSTANLDITVNDSAPVISYAGSPFAFSKSSAISSQTPSNSGGAIASCASSPALPAGLSISGACVITGTPTALSAASSYTITATNSGGSGSSTISIAVNDAAPAIDYIPTSYNFTFTKGTAIAALTPNNGASAGAITGCASTPALPAGLSLSATTCAMTGTPTGVVSAASYTITASNSGGSSTAVITLTVNDAAPAISFAGSPFSFTKSSAIAAQTPANSGGSITSCSSNPGLPNGLALSSACVITGTPTAVATASSHTITAVNTGGSSSATVSIAVNDLAPTISYAGSPLTYTVGIAMATLTPTAGGGTIASCASSPALPAGLSISSSCVITGTPTAPAAGAAYTITAANSGGTGTAAINITIANGPPILSYAGGPFTYSRGSPISTLIPSNAGGAVTSCSSNPALPAGLSLSSTCALSGSPSALAGATTYTITATNAAGSDTDTLDLTVIDVAPVISFSPGSVTYTLRTAVTAATPANTGGTIVSCASSPALPAGLSLSSACVVTGTPTALSASSAYTITATNTGGSGATTLNIRVKNLPVILFQSLTALDGAVNGAAAGSRNVWKVASDGVDRSSLTQNTNASLDSINPSWNADGTAVTYSSKGDVAGTTDGAAAGSYNVWTASATGASAAARTANTNAGLDADDAPQHSPDGTKIVYASKAAVNGANNGTASGSYNIWIMNADGTGKVALTANTNAGLDSRSPVFSPDGTMVFFSSRTASNGSTNGTATLCSNIWRINVDGTNKINLTVENTSGRDSVEPSVSPDGDQVVYASKARIVTTTANSYNIWKMNFNGTGKTSLTSNTAASLDSRNPRFSPDGAQIAFISRMQVNAATASSYNVWTMDESGLNQVPLTTNNAANLNSEAPHYSPDGLKLAFASQMNVGASASSSYNIFVMSSDGTGSATALTANTSAGLDSKLSTFGAWYAE